MCQKSLKRALVNLWLFICTTKFVAANGFDGESIAYWWEVNVSALESLEPEETFSSSMFSTWDDAKEEKWYLYLRKSSRQKQQYISIYLESLSDNSDPYEAEFSIYNNIAESKKISRNSPEGIKNFVKLDVLVNPSSGYSIDGKVKFGVRLRSSPPFLQVRGLSSMTYSWEVGRLSFRNLLDSRLMSPTFSTWNNERKEEWILLISSEGKDYISLFLISLNAFETSLQFVELFVRNADSTKDIYRTLQPSRLTFKKRFTGEGAVPFARVDTLTSIDEGFIHDGHLKFGVRMSSDAAPIQAPLPVNQQTSPAALSTYFSNKSNSQNSSQTLQLLKDVTETKPDGTKTTIGYILIKEGADTNAESHKIGSITPG